MLTLQYVPYAQIENLSHEQRVNKLLELVSENKIILIEGRLRKEEETELITRTMEEIDKSDDDFRGIELSTVEPNKKKHDREFFKKIKEHFINMLLGDRNGMTIIGPATVVKEIKQDPEKIELFINNLTAKSGNGRKKIKKKPKGKK
ncbi:MAG: DUF2073 domain-containing protein [Candidatus Woesearchaeota archaeon]